MLLRWLDSPFSPMVTELLAGVLLVVFGLILSRANSLLKVAQSQQITRLWRQRRIRETRQQPSDSSGSRCIIGGSTANHSDDLAALRSRVRQCLAAGLLPAAPTGMWVGPGTRKLCSVCATIIGMEEIEYVGWAWADSRLRAGRVTLLPTRDLAILLNTSTHIF